MAASMRVMPHIRRAAKACKPSGRYRRGIGITIHLKRCSNEGIHSILASKLTENTVRPQAAIPAGEENVGAGPDVFIHSHLPFPSLNDSNPSPLDRPNHCA